ncbi:hypothetical protein [Mucilaginibacter sp.]|uniref:hypothetical protein n=1 Tax=Mucilaginibacter sp. TaxID=1882438 RepID=UPI0035BBBC1B
MNFSKEKVKELQKELPAAFPDSRFYTTAHPDLGVVGFKIVTPAVTTMQVTKLAELIKAEQVEVELKRSAKNVTINILK